MTAPAPQCQPKGEALRQRIIGKFIFICDLENVIVAGKAVKWLHERPDSKEVMISQGDGDATVMMFAKRLKRSIRVQQVKP
jgi:uncharacterized Rossmann fold enzyme